MKEEDVVAFIESGLSPEIKRYLSASVSLTVDELLTKARRAESALEDTKPNYPVHNEPSNTFRRVAENSYVTQRVSSRTRMLRVWSVWSYCEKLPSRTRT